MSCRCEEIKRVEDLINQITAAYDMLSVYNSAVSELTKQMSSLADNLELAVTPDFAAPAAQKIRGIPGHFAQVEEGIRAKLVSKLDELISQMEELKLEDKVYHLQMEKRAKEMMAKKRGKEYLERL